MDFFKSRQNSTIYTDFAVIRHLQCPSLPFFSHLLAEDPGLSISNVVAILPDFDGFRPISSKLGYFFRFGPHPTLQMVFLTLCLPPARWGPRALDSQCSGNIAKLRWISSNFIKIQLFSRCNRHPATKMPKLTLCLPPARWGLRTLDSRCSGNIASFRWISFNFIKKTSLSIQSSDPLNAQINPLSPTCTLRTQDPRFPV